jgi:hypothetical protein
MDSLDAANVGMPHSSEREGQHNGNRKAYHSTECVPEPMIKTVSFVMPRVCA